MENAGHGTLKYGQRDKTQALSVNQRRWHRSTAIKSSGAESKTVSVHMHD